MIFLGGEPVDAIDQAAHESGWCGCQKCKDRASGHGVDRESRTSVPEPGGES